MKWLGITATQFCQKSNAELHPNSVYKGHMIYFLLHRPKNRDEPIYY